MDPIPSYLLEGFVEPWYRSIADPLRSQEEALGALIQGYAKTDYGRTHGADSVHGITDFSKAFPVVNYGTLAPYFERVRTGDFSALLPEPVARWVMTRGTTGRPKVIPVTESHLALILSAGARAIVNFGLKKNPGVLSRGVLNLNFPSEVGTVDGKEREGSVGYSSGAYAKLNPELGAAVLVPRQEEIDALGPGIARKDWEKRFELVFERARGADIGSTMGVTPVILGFASYLRRRHGVAPKGIWKPDALFCTSVAKIHSHYAPQLRHHFGEVPVVEMYTATEGVFAQQLDDLPYVCPNYDCYLFEVRTRHGVKMLHEMKRGEWGSMVVSTPLFPRYEIGDLIEAQGKGYFRVIGRAKPSVALEHMVFNLLTGRFF